MPEANILLDMDGVLANFVKATSAAHGREYLPESITQFNMAELWGLSAEEFWSPLSGALFWEDIEPYPWAEELLSELRAIAPVTICTAPSRDPHCAGGKLAWLKRELKIKPHEVVLCNKKYLLARPSNILIDDSDSKIKAFGSQGGRTILFPQPWNEHKMTFTPGLMKTLVSLASHLVYLAEREEAIA